MWILYWVSHLVQGNNKTSRLGTLRRAVSSRSVWHIECLQIVNLQPDRRGLGQTSSSKRVVYVVGSKVPSKVQVFLWRLARSSLPLKDLLLHKNMADSSACPICDAGDSWRHSLLECNMALGAGGGRNNRAYYSALASWCKGLAGRSYEIFEAWRPNSGYCYSLGDLVCKTKSYSWRYLPKPAFDT
jgi:hypothetical protein